jgi:hypothetical protein
MLRRDLSQPSFVDAMVSGYGKVGGFLDRIGRRFDWSAFEALLSPIHGSAKGVASLPAFDDVQDRSSAAMAHSLSSGAEEALRDRLSFRRFCGLPLDMETPDHALIWRFRQAIDKLGLSTKLLAEVNRQLDALGFVIKRGTLVDASLIAGAVRRPYEGGGVNPRDPEARFTRKPDKTYFGFSDSPRRPSCTLARIISTWRTDRSPRPPPDAGMPRTFFSICLFSQPDVGLQNSPSALAADAELPLASGERLAGDALPGTPCPDAARLPTRCDRRRMGTRSRAPDAAFAPVRRLRRTRQARAGVVRQSSGQPAGVSRTHRRRRRGQVVCEHRRVFARSHERKSTTTVYDWRHYLAVIQRKPGALRNGAPFVELPPAFRALQHA